jgi:hypothetical protein
MRKAVTDNDFESFENGLPSGFKKGQKLFDILRNEMGIKSFNEWVLINEAATLSKSNFATNPIRYDKFKTKINKGGPFSMVKGGEVVLQKFPFPEDPKSMPGMKGIVSGTEEVVNIPWSWLEKTSEFGGAGSSKNPTGEEWESLICLGVKFLNKIDVDTIKNSPEWLKVSKFWDDYGVYAMKLGQEFKDIFKLSDLDQLGGETRKTNRDWDGINKTPKTDMIQGNTRISLKKDGGSQLMSAGKSETLSTFKAALESYSTYESSRVYQLIDNIKENMNGLSFAGTIGSLKKMEPPFSDKDIAKRDEWKKLESEGGKLSEEINDIFESDIFKSHFCWEAATGTKKFKPSPDAIANSIVTFNPSGTISNMLILDNVSNAGKTLASGNDFYVAFKTGGGGSKPYLSLRTKKSKKYVISDSFSEIIKQEFLKESFGKVLLNEAEVEQLDEFQMFDKLKRRLGKVSSDVATKVSKTINALKSIFSAIMDRINSALTYIKTIGSRMMEGLMEFFGIRIKSIKVSGGGKYPLL